jgi:hypothetical protein
MNLTSFGILLAMGLPLCAATYEVAQGNPQAADDGPGTRERPWKSIATAARKVVAGDTVVIHDGAYREQVVVKTSGSEGAPIRFEAASGAHVVLTGADLVTGWQKVDGDQPIYKIHWPHRFVTWSKQMTHPGDEYHQLIGRCEQVAIDGYLLRQVLEAGRMSLGTFFVDVTNQELRVWDAGNRNVSKAHVEASVREEVFRVEGDFVQLKGLHFRFAANMAQHGAVVLGGRHDTMEDCVSEQMNASGATFSAPGQVVAHCTFRDNGQIGFGANGAHGLLITNCLVENNNTKGFDRGWEAGGDKLVLCRGALLVHSEFVRNRGSGIWFDIGNESCTVKQCLIADNEDAGIFQEISFGLHAEDNVIVGNGFASTPGAWGAQAGIVLSSSPDCVVERNLILGNREGFNFREQTRVTPRIGQKKEVPVWNHDELIRNNIIAFNRDAQIWGWFDGNDNRHWPKQHSADEPKQTVQGAKPADIAGDYGTKDDAGQPVGLSLDKLRLRFESNVYWADPSQGWFNWGVTWGRHKAYRELADFQTELGIDHDSRSIAPAFANLNGLDLRLKPEMMKSLQASYPQGPVPGVALGVLP